MNKTSHLNHNFRELDSLFNKTLIKISLNTTNKTGHYLALDLLREEIQKIICISVLIEFKIIFYSLIQSSPKNNETKLLVDAITKILLLSSKQKITNKLSSIKKQKFTKLNPFNSWLLKDIESDSHYLFIVSLKWLNSIPKKKNSSNLVESLIENFVVKLSNVMVYEVLYNKKLSTKFYMEYTNDFLVFKRNLHTLKTYFYIERLIQRIYGFLIKMDNNNCYIIICTGKGFLIKNLNYTKIDSNKKMYQTHTSFLEISNVINH